VPSNPEPLTPAVIAELERLLAEAKSVLPLTACCDNCDVLFGSNGETYLATMTDAEQADPAYVPTIRKAARALIVAAVNSLPALLASAHELSRRLEREGRLEAVKQAWKRVAGFAVCESCGPENHFRITIDYPTLEKAQDAYSAMAEITAALAEGTVQP